MNRKQELKKEIEAFEGEMEISLLGVFIIGGGIFTILLLYTLKWSGIIDI
jgi:hypothetical protein